MQFNTADSRPAIAERLVALSRVGAALLREHDEARLLEMIAQTACELTGAAFAAFSLRPVGETGRPQVPAEGYLFHLAAVVGVSPEQEMLLRRMPLGGEGLLAPIFHHGVPVRVADILDYQDHSQVSATDRERHTAHDLAAAYARGDLPVQHLRSLGVPQGHPLPRSFLGAPLLDLQREVRGGLLLGHPLPDQFSAEDELLLVGLASQAAVALENMRLVRAEQLQAQELQAIFESSADGILLVDYSGQVLRENAPARRLRLQLEQEPGATETLLRLLLNPARLALDTQSEQQHSVTLQRPYEQQEYVVTAAPLRTAARLSPKSTRPAQEAAAEESALASVVVWHEVTEIRRLVLERQQHAETEARRALFQQILDELPTSVYLVRGPEAHLVLANRASTTVWGATWRQEQTLRDFLAQHRIRITRADGRPLSFEHLATVRAVRNRETVHAYQEVIRHPDGTTLPVVVHAVALDLQGLDMTGQSGPEAAALVVHQDVSSLKEAERLKDDFISIAAHELRTPLAILKGFAQTLIVQTARRHGPELAEWQVEALVGIDQATGRMVELVDDLLDVSRLQAGRFTLHPHPTDLVALTQRVITRLQLTTGRHRLVFRRGAEHLVANLDPARMEQVLTNLVANAIKYSPEGGSIFLQLTPCQDGNHLQLSIRDEGIGIPVSQQAQIFGRFVRADNARLSNISGTGLGLYLCRELVEQHQGRIWFESTEGLGSTFFLTLPLFARSEEQTDSPQL
ncbi:MAG TPA: ATP-binding protein [Ktedonobacteraceae bacterium]|jgi:signal transduction histidine kinase